MAKFVIFIILAFQLALAQSEDPLCKNVKAEAYSKFVKVEPGVGFVIDDVRLFFNNREERANNRVEVNSGFEGLVATTTPLSSNIAIPHEVARKLFKTTSQDGQVEFGCNRKFRLGLKLGGHWFYVPSDVLVDQKSNIKGVCKLNIFQTQDKWVLLGQPFLNLHCSFRDRENEIGYSRKPSA